MHVVQKQPYIFATLNKKQTNKEKQKTKQESQKIRKLPLHYSHHSIQAETHTIGPSTLLQSCIHLHGRGAHPNRQGYQIEIKLCVLHPFKLEWRPLPWGRVPFFCVYVHLPWQWPRQNWKRYMTKRIFSMFCTLFSLGGWLLPWGKIHCLCVHFSMVVGSAYIGKAT